MPGTIKIGNEGFRSTIKTDGNNNLVLSTPNADSTVSFYSGSEESANRIRFIQDSVEGSARAIIHLSSSNVSNGGYNVDTPVYDRMIRANRDFYASNNNGIAVWNVGMDSSDRFCIGASIGFGSNDIFTINSTYNSGDGNVHINASQVYVTGSLSATGTITMSTASIGGGTFTSASLAAGGSSGGTPGGSDTQIQFNDGGTFGGDSDIVWNSTTNELTINGTLNATKKSFVINHPDIEGAKLHHGSLEGPEFGAYFRGKVDNDNKFMFPDYWNSLIDADSVTVHITPIGRHILPLYVKEVAKDYVYVNKKSNFYYYVCGERKDIEKLEIIQ